MKLIDVVRQLRAGELSKLSLGTQDDIINLFPHINLALTALHTRFPLRMKSVDIQQYDHISDYVLDRAFAQTNDESGELYKYILDTQAAPFIEDIIKIEQVFDELGCELPLNDIVRYESVYTPNYNTIQVGRPNGDMMMSVTYRADHPKILDSTDPNTFEVQISHSYLEPLLYFVAARVNSVMPSLDGQNTSNNFLMRYENACALLEQKTVLHKDEPSNMKLRDNGWV